MESSSNKPVAIVTGAAGGIGIAICIELAKAGYAEFTGRGPRGVKHQVLTPIGLSFSGCDLVGKLPTPASLRSAQSCAPTRTGQV